MFCVKVHEADAKECLNVNSSEPVYTGLVVKAVNRLDKEDKVEDNELIAD